MYIPEVKYAAPEPLTNHSDLSLIDFPNVYFVGAATSGGVSFEPRSVFSNQTKFWKVFIFWMMTGGF